MKNLSLILTMALAITQSSWAADSTAPQQVTVSVTENGFEPASIQVDAGREVVMTITRKTDATCATSVKFPKLKIKESLPLNKPVILKLGKLEKGEIKFSCGMGMLNAVINAR